MHGSVKKSPKMEPVITIPPASATYAVDPTPDSACT